MQKAVIHIELLALVSDDPVHMADEPLWPIVDYVANARFQEASAKRVVKCSTNTRAGAESRGTGAWAMNMAASRDPS